MAEPSGTAQGAGTFQARVHAWAVAAFGADAALDRTERTHRFVEESLELAQAHGCTEDEARQLVAYVFGRPVGESAQEVGGVMLTLAALCAASEHDMSAAGEAELARVWTKIEKIRAKQAAKPTQGPLPGPSAPALTPPAQGEPRGARRLAEAAADLIRRGVVSARSPLGDALLDYDETLCTMDVPAAQYAHVEGTPPNPPTTLTMTSTADAGGAVGAAPVVVGEELSARLQYAAQHHARLGYDSYARLLFDSAATALAARAREAEGLEARVRVAEDRERQNAEVAARWQRAAGEAEREAADLRVRCGRAEAALREAYIAGYLESFQHAHNGMGPAALRAHIRPLADAYAARAAEPAGGAR